MTLADWFRPRIDGTLDWRQSLAITLAVLLIGTPAYLWRRYDQGPKASAAEVATRVLGPTVDFQSTRVFNRLNQHGILPRQTRANVLVCGTALVDGVRRPVAVVARRQRRGRLVDRAVFTLGDAEHWLYPDLGPLALAVCSREMKPA